MSLLTLVASSRVMAKILAFPLSRLPFGLELAFAFSSFGAGSPLVVRSFKVHYESLYPICPHKRHASILYLLSLDASDGSIHTLDILVVVKQVETTFFKSKG